MPRLATPVFLVGIWLATWSIALLAAGRAYGEPLSSSSGVALQMPRPKACLGGLAFADLADDTGYFAPEGLSQDEITMAMERFLPTLERCIPAGKTISAQLTVHVEVACTGRVTEVRTVEDGDLSPSLRGCMENTLRYADLPAHDAADGFGFDYRLRLMYITPPKGR